MLWMFPFLNVLLIKMWKKTIFVAPDIRIYSLGKTSFMEKINILYFHFPDEKLQKIYLVDENI